MAKTRKDAQSTEASQLCTLRKDLEDCQKDVEAAKLKSEAAQQLLQTHLQGLESIEKKGNAGHIWLVTRIYDEAYETKSARCCGAFHNKQDALLRRELLSIRPKDEVCYDGYEYYVMCVCTDSANAKYDTDLEDDCLECPADGAKEIVSQNNTPSSSSSLKI